MSRWIPWCVTLLCFACRTEEPRFGSRSGESTSPAPTTALASDSLTRCRADDHGACLELAGSAAACVELGLRREPSDPTLALALYLTACEHGVLAGCANASDPLRAVDIDRARELAGRACEGGDATGCNNLGAVLQDTGRVDDALVAYRRGCDLGLAMACGQVGALGSAGLVPMNHDEITTMLSRACERADARSCANLGRVSVRDDPVLGRESFRRACELEYPAGCYDYALSLVRGEGGAVDRDAAALALRRSCELGYPDACTAVVAR